MPNASQATGVHAVTVGTQPCTGVQWYSDSELWCSVQGQFIVGAYEVEVVAGGVAPGGSAPVSAQCPPQYFGQANETCLPCPDHADCRGGLWDPIARVRCGGRALECLSVCLSACV